MTPPPMQTSAPRRALGLTAILTAAALVTATPSAAWAVPAPIWTGPSSPVAYEEQEGFVDVGQDITVAGGEMYDGGYLDFSFPGATTLETLALRESASVSTAAGAVSIVDGEIHLGNGTSADVIGSVDATRNGVGGALRVNFVSPFVNPGFEDGTTGWTLLNSRVDLGVTQIAGFTSIDRSTYGLAGGHTNDDTAPVTESYSTQVSTTSTSEGAHALQLSSTIITDAFAINHGPAVYSSPFDARAGDEIHFDWRAFAGDDNFHVFGYVLNTVTGDQTTVLDATGGNEVTSFRTASTVIPADGTYRFVFVNGTHDLTGGRAAGARMVIDNIRVFGTRVTAAVLTAVAQRVQYSNASDAPPAGRTITTTAAPAGSSPAGSATSTVTIAPVDDAPTFAAIPGIGYTNTGDVDSFASVTGVLGGSDPDSTISYAISGGTASADTIGGVAYTHRALQSFGTLHLNSATGAYLFVPDETVLDAAERAGTNTFTVELTAPDESPGSSAPAKTLQRSLVVTLDVTASAPSTPRSLTATGGYEQATLDWNTPSWGGGSAITGYVVEQSVDGGVTWTIAIDDTGSAATSAVIDGFRGGVTVTFRVRAINATGTGDASAASTAITPRGAPDAPSGLTAVPGDRRVALSWDAPAHVGSAPISGYRIETSTDGGTTWTDVVADTSTPPLRAFGPVPSSAAPRLVPVTPPVGTSYVVTGLPNGTTTSFRVSGINPDGIGAPSAPVSATPRTVPDAVRDLAATPADGSVRLTWTAPASDGGAAVTGYRIEQSVDGGSTWAVVTADSASTATSATVGGVANGESRALRVSAINIAGAGATASIVGRAATTPGAVTVTEVSAGNRSIEVSFTRPAFDGGSPVTAFEYSLDGGISWTSVDAASTSLRIDGVSNGTTYDLQVRARNAVGVSPASPATPVTPTVGIVRSLSGSSVPLPPAGSGESYVGGASVATTITRDGSTWVLTGPGYVVRVEALDADGAVLPLTDGAVATTPGGSFRVTGSGFAPGSSVDLWLFDGTVPLGSVTVASDGTFTAVAAAPANLTLGAHGLQINAENADGVIVTTMAGVRLNAAAVAPTPTPTPAPAPAGEELAASGGTTDTAFAAASVGTLLLLVGLFVVWSSRRRGELG